MIPSSFLRVAKRVWQRLVVVCIDAEGEAHLLPKRRFQNFNVVEGSPLHLGGNTYAVRDIDTDAEEIIGYWTLPSDAREEFFTFDLPDLADIEAAVHKTVNDEIDADKSEDLIGGDNDAN